MKITEEWLDELVRVSDRVKVRLGSPSQIVDKEFFLINLMAEVNFLVGYIDSIKNREKK